MTLVSAEALDPEVTILSETSDRVELVFIIRGGPRPGKERVGSSARVTRIYCICRCCTKNNRGLVQPLSLGGVGKLRILGESLAGVYNNTTP